MLRTAKFMCEKPLPLYCEDRPLKSPGLSTMTDSLVSMPAIA